MEDNPWDKKYLYYTNEHPLFNSVMKIDTDTMTLKADIHVWGFNPHSVDRACNTDKMYVRTQSSHSFAVIDAKTEECLKVVDLPFKPRTCGDQNYAYNLQLVSGNSDPGIAVINVDNDEVIFTDWEPANDRKPKGNQGGSSTGHAVWFDKNHFGYLNRLSNEIKIFKIHVDNMNRTFSFVYYQTITETDGLKTSLHTIQDDKIDTDLNTTIFYGTVEGYDPTPESGDTAVAPGIQEFTWNPAQGVGLIVKRFFELPQSSSKDTIHHYSILKDTKYLFVPTYSSRKTHIINTDTMTVSHTFNSGYGGGHVNFAISRGYAIVTNHFDQFVTVINYVTNETHKVHVNNDIVNYPNSPLLQTHSNWVSEDERYFYMGNSNSGEFVEVDLEYLIVSRKLFVGGHPEQSIS